MKGDLLEGGFNSRGLSSHECTPSTAGSSEANDDSLMPVPNAAPIGAPATMDDIAFKFHLYITGRGTCDPGCQKNANVSEAQMAAAQRCR